ncbi:sigma-70 family RNA polymerase sigma factor [Halobacillus rhizosphaerae]|uniref:RNA polymerase sigma factor n=1 Tax=Halobacillus rhizosphaerae TaxID=3064889 RepID=UPI00398A7952
MRHEREETLNHVVEEYYPLLVRTAVMYVKDEMAAEDMVQEALLKAFEKYSYFKKDCCFRTWLLKIITNQCKDHLRSYTRRNVVPWEDHWIHPYQIEENHPLERMLNEEENQDIKQEMGKLKPAHYEAIHLYYFADLSIKEISRGLAINENTLKTRMKRARHELKQNMEV